MAPPERRFASLPFIVFGALYALSALVAVVRAIFTTGASWRNFDVMAMALLVGAALMCFGLWIRWPPIS